MKQKIRNTAFGAQTFLNKAKNLFVNAEIDEDEILSQDTKNKLVGISSLNYVTKEILNHIAFEEIAPIITHKKFHELGVDKFALNQLEKKLLESHLFKLNKLKYSKATITFGKGSYNKEYKVIRFVNLDQLRNKNGELPQSQHDTGKISEFHLMLFELELNHLELK